MSHKALWMVKDAFDGTEPCLPQAVAFNHPLEQASQGNSVVDGQAAPETTRETWWPRVCGLRDLVPFMFLKA